MARLVALTMSLFFSCGLLVVSSMVAHAEPAPAAHEPAAATSHMSVEEFSAQSRRILRRRVPVYRRALGPNAVRVCNAHYEREYRPSGTVIVPRMHCYWRG